MNCCFTKRRWFFFCLMAEKMEGTPPPHFTYQNKPCYFTTAHTAVIFMYMQICDINLPWLSKVDFCTDVHRTSLLCLVYCSQLLGLSFMYGTYPLKCYFWQVVTSRKNSSMQNLYWWFPFAHIFLSELEGCRVLPFDAHCHIYPSLLRLDLDYYHILTLCYIKPMSDKKKKKCIFSCYCFKHVCVSRAYFFISSSLSESGIVWEKNLLG